ncbi:MAG: 50S ribosomal protein L9 [Candidatus Omnitrophota bacterium]
MEVILKQDVDKFGKTGTIIKVKDGFARNFLIPNNLAVRKTTLSLKLLEEDKKKKSAQLEKAKKGAEDLKAKLMGISLTVPVLAQEDDCLFGSITAAEISRLLKEEGFEVDKSAISLDEPIKQLGIYEVPIKLHPEVSLSIKVWVVKK